MVSDSLMNSIRDFFAILKKHEIEYVLVGGVAILNYVEGRNTQDLDLIMALSSLKRITELTILSRNKEFIRAHYGDLQIDILLSQNPFFKYVQKKYSKSQIFFGQEIKIASVEGLLLLKLFALPPLYRQGNFARVGIYENDIATLIHDYTLDTKPLLKKLSKYVNEYDFAEIRNILDDVENRIRRFNLENLDKRVQNSSGETQK